MKKSGFGFLSGPRHDMPRVRRPWAGGSHRAGRARRQHAGQPHTGEGNPLAPLPLFPCSLWFDVLWIPRVRRPWAALWAVHHSPCITEMNSVFSVALPGLCGFLLLTAQRLRTRSRSTSSRFSRPSRTSMRARAKSMAVPGPREVMTLPSHTTPSSTTVTPGGAMRSRMPG